MDARSGTVTFVAMRLARCIEVKADPTRGDNLLELAVRHQVPLPCDCRQGECGRCAVKVARLHASPGSARLTLRERYLLLQAGKISLRQFHDEYLPDHPALWRLACEYRIGDEEIMVAF